MKKIDNKFKFRLYLDTKNVKDGNYIMVACSWRGNRYKFSTNIHLLKNEQIYFQANNKVIDFSINTSIFSNKVSKDDQKLNIHLKLKKYADDIFNQYSFLKHFFDEKDLIGEQVTINELRLILSEYKATPQKTENFVQCYNQFLSQKSDIKKSTLERMNSLLTLIEKFDHSIDINFFNNPKNVKRFFNFLIENNYNNSTIINIFIPYIKRFMDYLFDKKEIKSNEYTKLLKDNTKNLKTGNKEVALTEKEIEKIVNAKLPDYLLYSRQLVIIQYYTALRVSDLMNLKPEHFDLNNNTIKIYQQKTDNYLVLPIHHKLKPIVEELQGVIKPYSPENYNLNIKKICKISGINQLIEVVKFVGTERKSETKEKWELITSHTLRRTAITHALQRGLLPEEMMQISGHKNRRSFDNYVKISREQAFSNFLSKF